MALKEKQRFTVGIVVAFGPEVRSFLYSGLAERLASEFNTFVIAAKRDTEAFRGVGLEVVQMARKKEPALLERMRYWVSAAHQAWWARKGHERWQHYLERGNGGRRRRSWAGLLGGYGWSWRALQKFETLCGRWLGTQIPWLRLLRERKVDCLLVSSLSSARTLGLLQSAVNLGVRVVGITNSWKDVYAKPLLHVVPSRVGVWSERERDALLAANPHVNPERVRVVRSLHLAAFLRDRAIPDRETFCRQAGLDARRPLICYTAASPSAVRNEEAIVGELARELAGSESSPQILLRINPMEDGSRFRNVVNELRDVIIQRPAWEWSEQEDWCCPLPEDLANWVATVRHSAADVSVASTVTMEFAAMGKPVINVCFDIPELLPRRESNQRFWYAPFYAEARENRWAEPAWSLRELVVKVLGTIRGESKPRSVPLMVSGNDAVERAVGLVEEALEE